ncbi:hypothetical protein DACRYDRAFT_19926 [Dacryopinax primogenitus]|uniref:Uncharacterized protein n=1 Tax=Dacryopinax primogenitus (strain DJM 731) TaxID=1858805 RepID=M5GAN3_DACPD|nr:uncharacterized protein DACRYDRAFT_19926 [Dacryopinax primogenitus]EJU05425.1 hypothetical protein DACRYDRAFT_19926 [Dacryopinax primogenitus]
MLAARAMVPVSFELHSTPSTSEASSVTSSAQISPSPSMDRIHLITPSGRALKTARGVLPHPGELTPEESEDEQGEEGDGGRKRSPLVPVRGRFVLGADEEDAVTSKDMIDTEPVSAVPLVRLPFTLHITLSIDLLQPSAFFDTCYFLHSLFVIGIGEGFYQRGVCGGVYAHTSSSPFQLSSPQAVLSSSLLSLWPRTSPARAM